MTKNVLYLSRRDTIEGVGKVQHFQLLNDGRVRVVCSDTPLPAVYELIGADFWTGQVLEFNPDQTVEVEDYIWSF